VEQKPNPRQQLKNMIFEAYRNCIKAPSQDILSKHLDQLWSLIQKWCKKYLFAVGKENETVDEMGECIYHIADKLVKKDRTIKTFEKLDEFFMYLNRMLKNGMIKLIYEQLPKSIIKARVKEYFYINRVIETEEREKKLTENRRIEIITDYMPINTYSEIRNQLNLLSLDYEYDSDNEDNKKKLIDFLNVKSAFSKNSESTNKFNVNPDDLREAVTYVLENKRQKRTRACNRALFTVKCIREAPDYLDKLEPVLDSELLNTYWERGIKPTQYEVYLKYHPGRKDSNKNSVESSASSDLENFLNDLWIYLKEKKS